MTRNPGRARLELSGARRPPRPADRAGARATLRRRGGHVVGDDRAPVRGAGRTARLLRPEPGGSLLPAAGTPRRIGAALPHALPVDLITEARWIARTLEELRPGSRVLYVRNGIAKDVFVPLGDGGAAARWAAPSAGRGLSRLGLQGGRRGRRGGGGHVRARPPDRGHPGPSDRGRRPSGHGRGIGEPGGAGRALLRGRRRAQALAHRGDVRSAARGLPSRRDLCRHPGHGPRRVRRAWLERARVGVG